MLRSLIILMIVVSVSEGCRSQVQSPSTPAPEVQTSSTTPKVHRSTSSLPVPNLSYIETSDPATITIRWDPVTVRDDNPILGFKIKLWEDQKKKVHKYVEKNGTFVEELVPIKKPLHKLPTHEPAFVAVVAPDVFTAKFENVKIGEDYEIRGQSFSADGDGPLSSATGIRLGGLEEEKKSDN